MAGQTVLAMHGVTKTYPGVRALNDVSFEVVAGEVHALLGENGAGKSTLISVAAGANAPDAGRVEIGGAELTSATPALARELGLAVVYQHTSVLDDLTAEENLRYAVPASQRGEKTSSAGWVTGWLTTVGADFDPATRVADLSAAQRQQLEIAKALASRPQVLILDEPTEALTETETEQLFALIDQITGRGTAVVYISHRLPEVKRIAERITVLRDGEIRGTFDAAGISERQILDLIVGRPIEQTFPAKNPAAADAPVLLTSTGIDCGGASPVDVTVRAGEILGLAGVEGNGQRELIRVLAGLGNGSGRTEVDGRRVSLTDPSHAQAGGIVYLPGDRQSEGLFLDLPVRSNISTLVLGKLSRLGVVSASREDEVVRAEIDNLGIKTASADVAVRTLSGGNAQKVLFARALAAGPKVLLADEPTRGVDAGARLELYRVLREAAEAGSAVIVLSSDARELQGLADRVLVFSRGEVARTLVGDEISEDNITGTALTAGRQRSHTATAAKRRPGLRRFLSGDYAPTLALLVLIAAVTTYASVHSSEFLGSRNLQEMLFLASALALTSIGQLIVLMTAGVDLSVGPMMGLTVVVMSFFAGEGQSTGTLIAGLVVVVLVGAGVGLTNGLLVRAVGLTPVITTIAMYIALQGVSLLLRPTPDGYLSLGFTDALQTDVGPVPVVFLVVIALVVVAELVLRFTRFGVALRAVGSDEETAHRLGARVNPTIVAAYVLCAVFAAFGGLLLSAQVGVGDPSLGTNYTLSSISAVVLGGASIFGGRGSFVGAFAGVVLIQEISTATGFVGLGPAWQYALPGLLILIAASSYSRARESGAPRKPGLLARLRGGTTDHPVPAPPTPA